MRNTTEAIAYRDIENIEEYNWVEASGPVEKMFKKYNAYNLPSSYASEVLNNTKLNIVDEYHYSRTIGNDNELFVKTIFGINSEDLIKKLTYELMGNLCDNVKHCYDMLRAAQSLKEDKQINVISSQDIPAELQYAFDILEFFDEAVSYSEIYEMPEDLLYYLKYAREVINKYVSVYKNIERIIKNIDYLLSIIEPLKIICKKAIEIIDAEENIA